jgi:hypothetical protein
MHLNNLPEEATCSIEQAIHNGRNANEAPYTYMHRLFQENGLAEITATARAELFHNIQLSAGEIDAIPFCWEEFEIFPSINELDAIISQCNDPESLDATHRVVNRTFPSNSASFLLEAISQRKEVVIEVKAVEKAFLAMLIIMGGVLLGVICILPVLTFVLT